MRKNSQDKYQKRRLLSTYFSVVVSISLVLFLVGLLGLLLLNSKKVADHFKEQIAFTIYINDTAKPIEIKQLQKSLALRQETKTTRFVSKEEAAETHAKEIGEDFMEFLGYNPLLSSIDVYFNASYVSPAFLSELQKTFEDKVYISEVLYDEPLVEILDENIKRITQWILILSAVFILVAILLINSSIRLSIYSKRMIIKTMQLVGATKSFIRKPFIWKHLQLGILGSLIALGALSGVLYQLNQRFPELNLISNPLEPALIFSSILAMGILITGLSTFFATQRFLNLTTEAVQ
ncbi:MAG: permease-like cell division protein FtsX [Flavobacteriaceae bacterium]|nr:permease-like cell division protein FtsX [Flavobacteriaceae bacterium]MDO7582353.1 permease-like cell division protein FtsX [Flavobacteriaceae bacterium]MDO7592116.1 permease-like cell division protein FtsX [Flavobacteriaceae bacterium]MDO7599985.1 permease-like cell division protein FtsX [Flavobacteriaceae bacterium]MDO7602624.1 permease-like cell division protein FtsX [Flavobacteriaceae bacterium]